MRKPRLLDLFCGAGGSAVGYARAGFEVVGVDIAPQPNYPFEFVQTDALALLQDYREDPGEGIPFDAIHASPPCHDHSRIRRNEDGTGLLLSQTVTLLQGTGVPWVCENVEGPKVKMAGWWFVLCGSMFDLKVRRHRRFGSSHLMIPPYCRHGQQGRPLTVTGHGGGRESRHSLKPRATEFWRYMEMPWMEGAPSYGVTQAIPPAYTEWIGAQLLAALDTEQATRA